MKNKKFKLKKWYPSLHLSWYVGMEVGQEERGDMGDFSPCSGSPSDRRIPATEVISNSEFWEEIVEPVFLVKTIIYPSDGDIAYLRKDGKYCYKKAIEVPNIGSTLEACLTKDWSIHSVERLSDNKTFTLGDKVFFHENTFNQWFIDNFHIREDGILIARSKDNQMVEYIDTICKVEPTSFISYDNLELTENSQYYVVTERFNFIQNGAPQQFPSFTKNKSKYFVFANKENATNFIIENKPCLSATDIINAIGLDLVEVTIIKNLVKSKL